MLVSSLCSACGNSMQGAFVCALGTVFHLNCFKCLVCVVCSALITQTNDLPSCPRIVAMSLHQSFFPLTVPTGNNNPFVRGCYNRFSLLVGTENKGGLEVREILTTVYREFSGCAHRCAGKLKRREQDRASPKRRGRVRSGTAEE